MGGHTRGADGTINLAQDWVATAAFRHVGQWHQKVTLVTATLGPFLDKALTREWSGLTSFLQKVSEERNTAAHAAWHQSPEYPDHLVRMPPKAPPSLYSVADFEAILARIEGGRRRIHEFLLQVLEAKDAGRIRVPPIN